MEERLGAKGQGLRAKLDSRGRVLPRKLRAEAELLVESTARAQNPRLARQIDPERAAAAYDALVRHLAPLGNGARRRRYALNLVATVVFVIMFTGGAVLALMAWRGYL
jgi:hypothetical protein